MDSFLIWAGVLEIPLALGITIFLARREDFRMQRLWLLASLCVLVSLCGYTLENTSESVEGAFTAIRVSYCGLAYVPTLQVLLMAEYCGRRIGRRVTSAMLAFDTLLLGMIFTTGWHGLFYRSITYVRVNRLSYVPVSPGAGYYLFMAYTLLLILLPPVWAVSYYRKNRSERGVLALGLNDLLPLAALPAYLAGWCRFDPIPHVLALLAAADLCVLWRYRMFDVPGAPAEGVLSRGEHGYVVINRRRRALYSNEIARQIFPALRGRDAGEAVRYMIDHDEEIVTVGEKRYRISLVPFYDGARLRGHTIWLFEKTGEYAYARQLLERKEQAEEANRAKSVFLANISHDIRTPLNVIIGYSETLLLGKLPEDVRGDVASIYRAGNVLLDMIDNLLDFSQLESGKTTLRQLAYSLQDMLREVAWLMQARAQQKGLCFEADITPELPRALRGDEARLKQVLYNLLNNAVKYTDSGFVRLTVRIEERGGQRVRLLFSVEDSGRGIRREQIAHLFERYERGDEVRGGQIEGTGLGLAISREIVRLFGGDIQVESTPGSGSRFFFSIWQDVEEEASPGSLEPRESTPPRSGMIWARGASVLVVDDDEMNRKVAGRILAAFGIAPRFAESGAAALQRVRQERFDLILLDQRMPELDGVETLARMREERLLPEETAVVALTADAVNGAREWFLQQGFTDFLSKPIQLQALAETLRRYLPPERVQEQTAEGAPGGFAEADGAAGVSANGLAGTDGLAEADAACGVVDEAALNRQLRALFWEDLPGLEERIRLAYETQDRETYLCTVHALKGLAAQVGEAQLSAQAQRQERAAREGDVDEMRRGGRRLLDSLHRAIEEERRAADVERERAEGARGVIPGSRSAGQAERARDLLHGSEPVGKSQEGYGSLPRNGSESAGGTPAAEGAEGKREAGQDAAAAMTPRQFAEAASGVLRKLELLEQRPAQRRLQALLAAPFPPPVQEALQRSMQALRELEYEAAACALREALRLAGAAEEELEPESTAALSDEP